MWGALHRVLHSQRGLLPFVRIVELGQIIPVRTVLWFLVDVAKRHTDRFVELYENFSRFIHNEYIAFQDSRVLPFSLLSFFRRRYIAEAVELKGMQDFDFADGKRDVHLSYILAKLRAHSGL